MHATGIAIAAVILTLLFPGLGHVLLGDWRRVALFVGLVMASIVFGFVGVGYLMYALIWFFALVSILRRISLRKQKDRGEK